VTEIPELRTERLLLRAFRYEDHERWAEIMRDERLGAGLGKPSGLTPHEAWMDMSVLMGHWLLRGYGHWALEELEGGELVGRAGLFRPPDWPELELGWTVARSRWGHGYASEAARAGIDWARSELGASHLISLITDDNHRSQRVAEKLGMTIEGRVELRGFEMRVYGLDI
jgi:RimJ/RimL family protein N-acetyltransferase